MTKDYKSVKEQMDGISPSFCAAKWYNVSIWLGNGRTASCHHPLAHSIPEKELKRNPSALHNTLFKKERRKEMLEGERPSECSYCWTAEDAIKEIGFKIKSALLEGDIDKLGNLFNQHWLEKKRISNKMSNPEIDSWYDHALKNGALGGKIMGAGGGGFMLLVVKQENQEKVKIFVDICLFGWYTINVDRMRQSSLAKQGAAKWIKSKK